MQHCLRWQHQSVHSLEYQLAIAPTLLSQMSFKNSLARIYIYYTVKDCDNSDPGKSSDVTQIPSWLIRSNTTNDNSITAPWFRQITSSQSTGHGGPRPWQVRANGGAWVEPIFFIYFSNLNLKSPPEVTIRATRLWISITYNT